MNKMISVLLCMGAMLAVPAGALAGSLSGRVTGWMGISPLAGIVVESTNVTAGVAGPSATTDATGMYTLTVAAGPWRVRFQDPNGVYMPEVYNNVFGDDFGLGMDLQLSPGIGVAGILASLEKRPAVTGVLPQEVGGNYHILFAGPVNMNYILQEAASLTSEWADVGAVVTNPFGTGVLSRTTSGTQAFWRVRLALP